MKVLPLFYQTAAQTAVLSFQEVSVPYYLRRPNSSYHDQQTEYTGKSDADFVYVEYPRE